MAFGLKKSTNKASANPFDNILASLPRPTGGEFGNTTAYLFEMIPELVPVDLVIDHSVQVNLARSENAVQTNMELNSKEIVNALLTLSTLVEVVFNRGGILYPDSVVEPLTHTMMIDGLGVAGWGVGGIEAEAAMLGQPMSMVLPGVVGFSRLSGKAIQWRHSNPLGLNCDSVVGHGVVSKATIANMSPEYEWCNHGLLPSGSCNIAVPKIDWQKRRNCE
ncbi:hypothetical protein HPP92_016510 [Vanilla planifolia]|uniref:Aconitase/3-isopropylmalate dehydratase large subunit alpha/beta/alpha domain-containing protein n=1 Tax=Vanilla planifolia TaxID=51239 RepID=A0A835URB9_VANPL|nr:hypothetical protein HPP92_016510 [Vanilla planifolia]